MIVFWVLWCCVMLSALLLQLWAMMSNQQVDAVGVRDRTVVTGKSTDDDAVPRVKAETA